MLTRIDRIQLVVPDREAAVGRWGALFGATKLDEGGSRFLNAHKTTAQAGETLFEFLQPAGPGPVEDFQTRWGQGLYGAGFSTPSLLDMGRHLDSQAVKFTNEKDQLFVDLAATPGMPTTIVEDSARERVGDISFVYEVTNPVPDWQDTAALYTRIFGLDPTRFSPITSEGYGYTGTLTLFDPPNRLDRIEITQTSDGGAMDRFFQKRGPSLYMCYIEVEDVTALAGCLEAQNLRFNLSEGQPEGTGLFIHPSALFGMLMGVSKTNYAWTWSGRPQLAGVAAPASH
jgi:catechol 2,3-dioxygenase-like lactoylglutathione lyase family enzyme